jgi:hypothetical protein
MREQSVYNPEIQEMRDQAAAGIRGIRKQRDVARKESKRPLSRIKEYFNFDNSQSRKADRLSSDAKSDLYYSKRKISDKEHDLRQKEQIERRRFHDEIEKNLLDLLVDNSDEPLMDSQAFLDKRELLERGLKDPEIAQLVIDRFNRYFGSPVASIQPNEGFNKLVTGMMAANAEAIEKMCGRPATELNALEAERNLIEFGDDAHKLVGKHLLLQSRNQIMGNLDHEACHNFVGYLYEYSDPEQQHEIENRIQEFINNPNTSDRSIADILSTVLVNKRNQKASAKARGIISGILNRIGVGKEAIKAWVQSGPQRESFVIGNNLRAILELEKKAPGAARWLAKEYGVLDFARYPLELLEQQYANRDDKSKPYGIVIFPRADHNSAFYQDKNVFVSMMKQLADQYYLRVAEAESKVGVIKRLVKFTAQYGPISFAFIGGHGSPGRIQFGESFAGYDSLTTEDLTGQGAKRAGKFFVDQSTIILASCSTGRDSGIAQQLSERLNATVIAPNTDTSIAKVEISFDQNHPTFNVKYTGRSEKYYEQGRKRNL